MEYSDDKQILFISDWMDPFDSTYGGSQRSNLLLQACTKVGSVDVVAFADGVRSTIEGCSVIYSGRIVPSTFSGRLKKWLGLLSLCNPNSIYPVNYEKERIIDQVVSQKAYDVIVVRYISEALSCGLNKYADRLVVDVDDHPKDAMRIAAKRAKTIPNKLYHYLASLVVPIMIRRFCKNAKALLFSNFGQVDGKNGFFLPNVPWEEPVAEYADFNFTKPSLFFVGKLDHYPNYQGLDHFVDKVWPVIRSKVPDAELRIAGKIEQQNLIASFFEKWKKKDGVLILGFVSDIAAEYSHCRASISPIYVGAGTNIKLIESMQRKRVCVTTSCGIRGMEPFFEKDVSVLVADDDDSYARLCVRVLKDEDYNHTVAFNAFEIVEKSFSHAVFNRIVKEVLSSE